VESKSTCSVASSRANEAVACFQEGFNCSQAVFSTYCVEFGLDKTNALKIACGLGGGMGRLGETCGAVTGAFLIIGLKHGKFVKSDNVSKETTYKMVQEFAKLFEARNKTINCTELLGIDILSGDKKLVGERQKAICPGLVKDAAEILETFLARETSLQDAD